MTFNNDQPQDAIFKITDIAGAGLLNPTADDILSVPPVITTVGTDTVTTWSDVLVPTGTSQSFTMTFQIDPNATDRQELNNEFFYEWAYINDCEDGDTDTTNNTNTV